MTQDLSARLDKPSESLKLIEIEYDLFTVITTKIKSWPMQTYLTVDGPTKIWRDIMSRLTQ